jgi:thiosulfate/3-mercaptopyruvate sulfurtransferase
MGVKDLTKDEECAEEGEMRWLGPEEFNDLIRDKPTILDCQPNVHDYIHQHIQGAVYVNEESFRLSRMGMPHVWLPEELAQLILRQLGVSNDRPVAIYGSIGTTSTGDGMAQMVLAYSLARYGHRDITVLDGGLERWEKESMPSTQATTKGKMGDFEVSIQKSYSASTRVLEAAIVGKESLIIDNRFPELYSGDSGFPKSGHIPGAINLPWTKLILPNNPCQIRSMSYLRDLLDGIGAMSGKKVLLYCATGRKSAALFNIMRFLMHYENVRLYEGSFTEWCADKRRRTVVGLNP